MRDKTTQQRPATIANQPPPIPQMNNAKRKHSSMILDEQERSNPSLFINESEGRKAKRVKATALPTVLPAASAAPTAA